MDGRAGGLREGSVFSIGSSSVHQKKHCLLEAFLSLTEEKI